MAMLPWKQIDTVLLDMDGTLLDLHFDNHFWLELIPAKLAERDGVSLEAAKARMQKDYDAVTGTIAWYCLDYWAERLQMDIVSAKREVQHLISLRDDTIPFLDALHQSGRQVVLVTNAHPGSLSLKVERTQLDQHIDLLISTHEFGVTKESQSLWQQLQARLGFDPARTLFVDDSLVILEAARQFGIGHLLAVSNPDSKKPVRDIDEFPAVQDYRYLLEDILANPVSV
ncbi:GMP/IMP nucleotidase [Bowmanella sp. Y26]|uniref:GMP/IMP nucleotidase n=1 Tax=Bowmanella yangjiangensis TaxID=2811230 RepID=A0ABS3CRV4_9ALTE|nr:GMP/IMP nucleotidase [Bowmanella yangjiangensis]MBN7819161.1 GMP/IMP nucleotidase [Bowmanella yangjiangensis]MBT1065838.1 GMP/IMP nucleotidase [Bowmanella yangjiangensis]